MFMHDKYARNIIIKKIKNSKCTWKIYNYVWKILWKILLSKLWYEIINRQ